jgi:tetratricopeptide (TPR) repeat protein
MNNNYIRYTKIPVIQLWLHTFIITLFFIYLSFSPVWAIQKTPNESPIELPKTEGSKNFDLEIGKINSEGIKYFNQKKYGQAVDKFNKAINLANQLRSPGKGILYYNHALSAHEYGEHEKAIKSFLSSRRFARGNENILNSKLLKLYECGLNPSVVCKEKIPLSLNIEGSH